VKNRSLVHIGAADFIGTFMLVFVGAGSVVTSYGGAVGIALAHGLIRAVVAYTFGDISEAPVNPAVTLGMLVGGRITLPRAALYWFVQITGGLAAAVLLWLVIPGAMRGDIGATVPAPGVSNTQTLVLEAVLTFFLVSTVYQAVAYGKGGPMGGLMIGLALAACILVGGNLTGASLNPARTIGPGLISGKTEAMEFYLVGTCLGGSVAGWLHATFFKPENTSA
jgi:aquaporin Z